MEKKRYDQRVFLVEDNETISSLILRALKPHFKEEISAFFSGEAFLKALKNEQPDIVLLDHMLPGMDGLEVIEEIKLVSPQPCVIILSSQTDSRVMFQHIKNGVYDYIVKDDNMIKNLLSTIHNVSNGIASPLKAFQNFRDS